MNDAPKRIYYAGGYAWENPTRKQDKTEYIRKDLYDKLVLQYLGALEYSADRIEQLLYVIGSLERELEAIYERET
jgi:hypothetical protein